MSSTAYSRPSKLPGGAGDRRLPPRLMKIEPKKLGLGLLAGGCLANLFAIYSPVSGYWHASVRLASPVLLGAVVVWWAPVAAAAEYRYFDYNFPRDPTIQGARAKRTSPFSCVEVILQLPFSCVIAENLCMF
ncbi:uncharacterized protein LOC124691811 isoform X2 [Lolium rigidum]|uniref:uncharacterized protein LOC124691811 isoform X2 n=1 Tax=Lolium rigidum TaxID=89674 RepID=UPI001F5C3ED9|nr:uncharacterized protein LOC124691811 isoform X2 [Lolium rigidum]